MIKSVQPIENIQDLTRLLQILLVSVGADQNLTTANEHLDPVRSSFEVHFANDTEAEVVVSNKWLELVRQKEQEAEATEATDEDDEDEDDEGEIHFSVN